MDPRKGDVLQVDIFGLVFPGDEEQKQPLNKLKTLRKVSMSVSVNVAIWSSWVLYLQTRDAHKKEHSIEHRHWDERQNRGDQGREANKNPNKNICDPLLTDSEEVGLFAWSRAFGFLCHTKISMSAKAKENTK